jgi:hypothetical protein
MLVPLPLHPGVVGPFPGTGCLVPQPFAAGGNRLYLEFWAITGGPRYSGYITPTVAQGQRQSLDDGQNRYSYGIVGNFVG